MNWPIISQLFSNYRVGRLDMSLYGKHLQDYAESRKKLFMLSIFSNSI
jgi:hypothetical protein